MALHVCPRRTALYATNLPVYDFLAPSLLQAPRAPRQVRLLNTTKRCSSATDSNETSNSTLNRPSRTPMSGQDAASNLAPLNKPLTQAQRDFLTSAVRPPPNTSILSPHPPNHCI
jgi:ubiquinone biosynthesis monooxygenase Coq7